MSIFSDYKQSVMKRAWHDYKVKKSHKGYEDWTFANSLYWAHKSISSLYWGHKSIRSLFKN